MKAYIFIVVLLCSAFSLEGSLKSKISTTSTKLQSTSKDYASINKKMFRIAKNILKQKKSLRKSQKYLAKLKKNLKEKERSYKGDMSKLQSLKKYRTGLNKEQSGLKKELFSLMRKMLTLEIILKESNVSTQDALIEVELYKNLHKEIKKEAKKINKHFFYNTNSIQNATQNIHKLKESIATIEKNKKRVQRTTKANKKSLQALEYDLKSYKKKLQALLSKQDTLKKMLAKLNIIKLDNIQKEKRRREEAFRNAKLLQNQKLPKVKKHGNSYQKVKTKRYRGKKTIAPLKSYKIVKKYGSYTDPIYGIKIFNKSISLEPKHKDAKVRTVFNGKVIYAAKTAVLNHIVIIEHRNGMHTIYANLSKILYGIKKGKKIKKGYTIGRVSKELIFEVTQKSYHLNPIELFK